MSQRLNPDSSLDTHNKHRFLPPIPDGDVIIHAGDITRRGTEDEVDARELETL